MFGHMRANLTAHRRPSWGTAGRAAVLATAFCGGAASPIGLIAGQVLLPRSQVQIFEQGVLRASHEWFRALMSADLETIDRLETDDFLAVQRTSTGVAVVAKERQLQGLRETSSNGPRFERELLNVKVRRYGTVAVLTGLATFRGRLDDKPVVSRAVVSEVWVSEAGGWRLAHFQTTDVPAPPAR